MLNRILNPCLHYVRSNQLSHERHLLNLVFVSYLDNNNIDHTFGLLMATQSVQISTSPIIEKTKIKYLGPNTNI